MTYQDPASVWMKTELCRNYPACKYGKYCLFAHSENELRAPRVCLQYLCAGDCPYDNCRYVHVIKTLEKIETTAGNYGPLHRYVFVRYYELFNINRSPWQYIETSHTYSRLPAFVNITQNDQ